MDMQNGSVWVFIESRGDDCGAGLNLIAPGKALASKLGGRLECIILGGHIQDCAEDCSEFGADAVLALRGEALDGYGTDAHTTALEYLAKNHSPQVILFEATDVGRELSSRLAFRLSTGLAVDCVGFNSEGESGVVEWNKSVFGGELNIIAVCKKAGPQLGSVRRNTYKIGERIYGRKIPIKIEVYDHHAGTPRISLLEFIKDADDGKIAIEDAEVVVAGGLGVGGKEGFALLWELAKLLGGTVGASRAATDEGWISSTHLVGQTGKIISPKLYIACGISGALQHTCGMSGSDVIIAINKDAGAPIFQTADYGIVGDMFKVLPALIGEIKARRK